MYGQGKELGVPIEVYILIIRQAFSMKSQLLPTTQIVALKLAFDGHRELEKLIDQMRAILLIPLAACVLFAVVVVPATGAVIELPAIVVTGRASKPPDIVDRDRAQRSQDVHWPPDLTLRWSEMFAHNEIEINAPCATVWNRLVQAQLWPQWFPNCGYVKIRDGSHTAKEHQVHVEWFRPASGQQV
jgi:hypothetical protein